MNGSQVEDRYIVTPVWHVTDTFKDHDKIGSAFAQLNCVSFVLGFIMNILVAYAIKRKGIKSPVDVCTLMISASNWVTVLLDLFVGISYIHDKKPMAFGSFESNQLWGFLRIVNHEWLAALVTLLVLSNLINRSKVFIFLMAAAGLIIECILLMIPLALGPRFIWVSNNEFLGGWKSRFYMGWLFITEVIPYLYFYLAILVLLLANVIRYSNIKQGYVEASRKKTQDTLTAISYAAFYLITDIPKVFQHVLWGAQLTFLQDCEELFPVILKTFYASLFINTIRAAAFPLVFFFTKYSWEAFVLPLKKIANMVQAQTRYRRFYGDDQASLRYTDIEVEEYPVEEV